MDGSTPGFAVHHQLPEPAQTNVHRVSDAIQPSYPLTSPSPPAFNLFQHQGLFRRVCSSHQVAKVLQFQHQSLQWIFRVDFLSVQFSCSVMSDSLQPHGRQHTRLPCPSSTPRAYSNSCPSCRWHHPTISYSFVQFPSCLQSLPESVSFPKSQFFASGGQIIGVSASTSLLPMNIQCLFPLGLTDWISLQSKGLSRVFSNTIVQIIILNKF